MNCRAIAGFLHIREKSNIHGTQVLDDPKFRKTISRLWRKTLGQHVHYLTARQSRDVIQLARQQITAEGWNSRLNDFEVFISQIVIDEASSGDPDAARKRMKAIQPFPLLEITDEVTQLAEIILGKEVDSRERGPGCHSYRHFGLSGDEFSAHMELQTYCLCGEK